MDNVLPKGMYKDFRNSLQGNINDLEEMCNLLIKSIIPIAKALRIGLFKASIMSPNNKNGLNGTKTFFESSNGYENTTLIETFRTSDNGIVNFSVNPQKNHKFSEEEIQIIKLIAIDIYVIVGRTHLMNMVVKARLTDPMTGVSNSNNLLQKSLNLKISKELHNFTSIFINLKNYKYINNTKGSIIGDQGIIIYAKTANKYLKGKGEFARLGGDNFIALIKNELVYPFLQKFSNLEISYTESLITHKFNIQARMGVYPIKETDSMSEAMHGASIALNYAKHACKKDIVWFTPNMLETTMHEKQISATFQEAFKKQEFLIYYQPKICVETKELYGAEALVRWNMEDHIAPPSEFLPILEKESSICQLDFFVFETVCSDLRKWLDANINPVRISANFSKLHLKNKYLANDILAIMKKYDIKSKYIEIELTEVSDFEDSVAMQNFVNNLREKGISVSIDDFGTGYSTLNALTNIDANIIKLDKSLLDNIGENNTQDKIILKNMVSMMHELNKEVIAEGVETNQQLEFLKGIKCPLVQGFVYDEPLPRIEFEKRLLQRRVY